VYVCIHADVSECVCAYVNVKMSVSVYVCMHVLMQVTGRKEMAYAFIRHTACIYFFTLLKDTHHFGVPVLLKRPLLSHLHIVFLGPFSTEGHVQLCHLTACTTAIPTHRVTKQSRKG
jgi:hypothetical protein